MTKSKTYRAGKSPAPPRSTSSKTVVLHLLPETDNSGYPQFNFEREIFKYSPDVTLPFAYSQECNFVSTPEEIADASSPGLGADLGLDVTGSLCEEARVFDAASFFAAENVHTGDVGATVREAAEGAVEDDGAVAEAVDVGVQMSVIEALGKDKQAPVKARVTKTTKATAAKSLSAQKLEAGGSGASTTSTASLVTATAAAAESGPAQKLEAPGLGGGTRYAERVCNILREFETKGVNGEWPCATNVACYWCCHRFDGVPMGLPVRFCGEDDGFYATGCFCGTACAAAFNQNSNESNNVKCGRHNMLCMLSMALGNGEEITVAPPRTVLNMFGGYATIVEFRLMCGEKKIFLSSMPPMRFLTMQIEEVNNANVSSGFRDKVVPLDTERIERCITLRRTKPLLDYKNTLDHSMRLTITQTSSPPVH